MNSVAACRKAGTITQFNNKSDASAFADGDCTFVAKGCVFALADVLLPIDPIAALHRSRGFRIRTQTFTSPNAAAADTAMMITAASLLQKRCGELHLPVVIEAGEADKIAPFEEQSCVIHEKLSNSELWQSRMRATCSTITQMMRYWRRSKEYVRRATMLPRGPQRPPRTRSSLRRLFTRYELDTRIYPFVLNDGSTLGLH
ncbi:MAG: hypothetical protein ACSLE1_08295 [Sphingobium sp.]